MLSDMNDETPRQIRSIREELAGIGPLRPGTLYTHYSVCGKFGCRCSDKKNPAKHGPYFHLSYTLNGKSHTEFIPKLRVSQTRLQIRNYKRLMTWVKKLVEANIRWLSGQRRRG